MCVTDRLLTHPDALLYLSSLFTLGIFTRHIYPYLSCFLSCQPILHCRIYQSHQHVCKPRRSDQSPDMEFYNPPTRDAIMSRQAGTPAILQPAATTKDELRAWRQARPLSSEEHTDLTMTMWKRGSKTDHQSLTTTPRSSSGSAVEPLLVSPSVTLVASEVLDVPASPTGRCGNARTSCVCHVGGHDDPGGISMAKVQVEEGEISQVELESPELATKRGSDFWRPVLAFLRAES